jgi:hypothetical protein
LVSLLEQVGHGDVTAMDVVNADAAPVLGPGGLPVHEHDWHAERRQAAQSGAVVVHSRDQHTVHALLKKQPEVEQPSTVRSQPDPGNVLDCVLLSDQRRRALQVPAQSDDIRVEVEGKNQ